MDEVKEFIKEMSVIRHLYGDTMWLCIGTRQIAEAEIEDGMTERELNEVMYNAIEQCWDFANWQKEKSMK